MPRLQWNFEINAHLHPKTNDINACIEEQVARGTRTRGLFFADPQLVQATPSAGAFPFPGPPAGTILGRPNTYPLVEGPNWGADDCTKEWDRVHGRTGSLEPTRLAGLHCELEFR